jgi:NAD(P)H-hydrate epimerase
MSRLCGKSIQDILKNPIKHATDFSKKYNCTIVLKTANTVVTSPDKKNVYINHTGNSGLSKGGSGDLLAGIMVSLLAQGMSPMEAACASVYIHGECADELSKKLSKRGMLVSDLIDYLPVYLKKYE